MCHRSCLDFGRDNILRPEIAGKDVLEVGSFNESGTCRLFATHMSPSRYVGVDIRPGPGVDVVCAAEELVATFGENSFDFVICTETLEHLQDWKAAVSNIKRVLRPECTLLLTTRSEGYVAHSSADYWRFSLTDMKAIFSDLQIVKLLPDLEAPGVFYKGRKPIGFQERGLTGYEVSAVTVPVPVNASRPRANMAARIVPPAASVNTSRSKTVVPVNTSRPKMVVPARRANIPVRITSSPVPAPAPILPPVIAHPVAPAPLPPPVVIPATNNDGANSDRTVPMAVKLVPAIQGVHFKLRKPNRKPLFTTTTHKPVNTDRAITSTDPKSDTASPGVYFKLRKPNRKPFAPSRMARRVNKPRK